MKKKKKHHNNKVCKPQKSLRSVYLWNIAPSTSPISSDEA